MSRLTLLYVDSQNRFAIQLCYRPYPTIRGTFAKLSARIDLVGYSLIMVLSITGLKELYGPVLNAEMSKMSLDNGKPDAYRDLLSRGKS